MARVWSHRDLEDRVNVLRERYDGEEFAAAVAQFSPWCAVLAFALLCPKPMPHKVYGLSLADDTVELQKIDTVLWRQTLDNLYKSNNPRPIIGER